MEIRSISHRRRHRDHRSAYKTAHNTGKSTLHASHSHNTIRVLNDLQPGKQPVHSTYTNIINSFHVSSKIFCSLCCFLGHRNICSACSTDSHLSLMNLIWFLYFQDSGNRVILNFWKLLLHQLILCLGSPCSKYFSLFHI